jgi:hypothetical protein
MLKSFKSQRNKNTVQKDFAFKKENSRKRSGNEPKKNEKRNLDCAKY